MKQYRYLILTVMSFLLSNYAAGVAITGKAWHLDMNGIYPSDEEIELIDGHLSNISFMTHATDPNLVYYIPPFVPVEGIAGTLFTNALIVKRADRIDNEFKDVLVYYKERKTQLEKSYDSIQEKLAQLPADEDFIRNNMQAL